MLPACEQAGVYFDFAYGCRVIVPPSWTCWRVRMTDLDSGFVALDESFDDLAGGVGGVGQFISSPTRYFTRWRLEVWRNHLPVMAHDYDARGKPVLMKIPRLIGDTFSRMRAVLNFHKRHKCATVCEMEPHLIPLFAGHKDYAGITFAPIDDPGIARFPWYALYTLAIRYDDPLGVYSPYDQKQVGLIDHAAYTLGVPSDHEPPRVQAGNYRYDGRNRYVCIAVQATTRAKRWNNAAGWAQVVEHLRGQGYRILCIDHMAEDRGTAMPAGAEDCTGERPLTERAATLKGAAFFVGLSSGLSWLAWACRTPVVLISGFTNPINEFPTPWRVTNTLVCHGCWNDQALTFDQTDFEWCPRSRAHECTREISGAQVVGTIEKLRAALRV